jgi:hypothetical protein
LENATNIGNFAFFNCTSLKSISINKACVIGEYAFQYCDLEKIYLLSDGIEIQSNCFERNYNLKEVILPKKITI